MILDDTWFGMEGTDDGKPFLIRGRENLRNFMVSGLYKNRLDICWPYVSSDSSLMPDEEDFDLMSTVEDLLAEDLENDFQSVLAFVYTGNNQRIWYWYTKSVEDAIKRINVTLGTIKKLPIEFYSAFDPDWQEYNSIID